MLDMNMFVEEAVSESGLTSVSAIVKDVAEHMEPMPIDRIYVAARAKFVLESMGKEVLT
jgi:hypothetical protein